eukprot:TRINITY_DN18900_c0_g1_i1.p1 TRINITY_DN18900_c0_g1~~TRINITY_DN18900_c0_g1_i1.p1  ORF type:complete len:316 (-),score=64.35 TRINITY_DN18900_c0_g1_i1:99-1046(-)
MESVVFLGTSAGTPTKTRNVSSLCLRMASGRVVMVDCGEGTQHQILRCDHVKLGKIASILVTHMHGDHIFGLPGLIASMCMLCPDRGPLSVYGPKGIEEYIMSSLRLSLTYLPWKLQITEIDEKGQDLGMIEGTHVTVYPITHKVPCFGYVLCEPEKLGVLDAKKAAQLGAKGKELGMLKSGKSVTLANGTIIKPEDVVGAPQAGRKVVILGDTSDPSAVLEPGRNCDVLIHECTLDGGSEEIALLNGHSTSAMAGAFAVQMKARRLLLNHFSMRFTTEGTPDKTVETLVAEAKAACGDLPLGVVAADDLLRVII